VTSNAVLASPEHRVKVSLRSPYMLPRAAVVDPALTYDLPPDITARTGMDALTQVLEPFVSNKANPLTDAICREGLVRASRSLRTAYERGSDSDARADMALASLFGGLALANAKLGAVHGFAGPIGGMFDAPHGAVCAALLAPVMRVNIHALRERDAHGEAMRRYDEIARLLTGDPHVRADDGADWVADLAAALKIPRLTTYGIMPQDIPTIAEKSAASSSMQGNPIKLTSAELHTALEMAL
jgi:alcohol dehydrogenase class IV